MAEEVANKNIPAYNWEALIREARKIRRDYDRSFRPYYQGEQQLVIKHKEYQENKKLIERGLMRWECIRRNDEFRRLYQADNSILRLGEDIQITPQTTKDGLSKELAEIKTKVNKDKSYYFLNKKHEAKYTAYFYFLKNIGHAQLLDNSPVGSRQLHALIYDMLNKEDIEKYTQQQKDEFVASIPKKVDFVVDFSYNKQEIMHDFEKQVDMWLRLYEAIGQRNDKRSLDYLNIKHYLEIYDFRNRHPKIPFSKLAERFYPSVSKKNWDSAIQQVKREYKRACELINGGFIFIK